MSSNKIRVAVRVRPFSKREVDMDTQSVIEMAGNQTILKSPSDMEKSETSSRRVQKTFAFDHCFDSINPAGDAFASQETVFSSLGKDILENSFTGYNACIFAYGQTGSGKSYTMMGGHDSRGLIPRLCDTLFDRISTCTDPDLSYKVEVSYMEIYNEKVHDLLDPRGGKQSLKVREHNLLGPYVDGLSVLAVSDGHDIEQLMVEGNKSRTVAATNMNSESSRSHAVFTVILTQTLTDRQSGVSGEKVSRISLVDLAGSERAVKTGAAGDRLKEGSNINKSLTTLGLVISKLADASAGKSRAKDNFVPYRDSVLTWLLKDNLGGNSKTVMVATISPASDNYEETLSTLRYADRAKRIVNHAVVNEDPNARIIRELRDEVEQLRDQLVRLKSGDMIEDCDVSGGVNLREKLTENEKIMRQMSETWEEKLQKTDRVQQERQQALEKMGISVQSVGISVQKNKFYLVNLNADPSLNEMLVYYLKDHTVVGLPDTPGGTDIQLSGLGIQPEHCRLIVEAGALYMVPVEGARCCVNGSQVTRRQQLQHGDRLLWGNNHFFRVNCPRASGSTANTEPQTPAQNFDYDFAREELVMKELGDNPIQSAIQRLEHHHQQDKEMALEQQRQEYERQFEQLRSAMSPSGPGQYGTLDGFRRGSSLYTPLAQSRLERWAKDRQDQFRRSVATLRQEIVRANSLAREASSMADELRRSTSYSVTLQIPPENLGPNRRRGLFVCEPAICVKRRGHPNQIWSLEKLDNKMVDMRELFNEIQSGSTLQDTQGDPFFETQENHHLIGVANLFLEAVLHDVQLNYHIPIISQQGEVAGRLEVELERVAGCFQDRMADSTSNHSGDSGRSEEDLLANTVTCRVSIKQATGLPASLSHFVFCQYNFWGCSQTQVCPPIISSQRASTVATDGVRVQFDHCRDFVIPVCEEFIEHCAEGALSVEVWGHRSAGFTSYVPTTIEVVDSQLAKARSLADRWAELTRKLELWVELQELNDQGDYQPVEVVGRPDVISGGVYQLRQGQQRRLAVRVTPVPHSGTLPLICDGVTAIGIGSVTCRSRLQKPLDSYQEEDLNQLRERWSSALVRRRQYLDSHLQRIIKKQDKSEADNEREKSLLDQWIQLNEERNAVLVPAAGSGIPGSPLSAHVPQRAGLESHVPVIFLNLNADDMTTDELPDLSNELNCAGQNSYLPKEHGQEMVPLHIIRASDGPEVTAMAHWDSSVHDSVYLNRITPANERVYLVLVVRVRLSQPLPMDVVLRKRLCVTVYKQSFTNKLMRSISLRRTDQLEATGVVYEVVSNIPKASEELEHRESLAQMAASGLETGDADRDTYIEKYLDGVSAVESILRLDRLRQSVAVREQTRHPGGAGTVGGSSTVGGSMRKTASVPNISYFQRSDSGNRSESFLELSGLSACGSDGPDTPTRRLPLAGAKLDGTSPAANRPTFLNLSTPSRMQGVMSKCRSMLSGLSGSLMALHEETSTQPQPPSPPPPLPPPTPPHAAPTPSPGASLKMGSLRMSTLHEDHDHEDALELTESTAGVSSHMGRGSAARARLSGRLRGSRTFDSLVEIPAPVSAKTNSPSITSSGYGSQAVSSSNLCSDDSVSLQSMDDTPDSEATVLSRPAATIREEELAHEHSGELPHDAQQQTGPEPHGCRQQQSDPAAQQTRPEPRGSRQQQSDTAAREPPCQRLDQEPALNHQSEEDPDLALNHQSDQEHQQDLAAEREQQQSPEVDLEQQQSLEVDLDGQQGLAADQERKHGLEMDQERQRGLVVDLKRQHGPEADQKQKQGLGLDQERQQGLMVDLKRQQGLEADQETTKEPNGQECNDTTLSMVEQPPPISPNQGALFSLDKWVVPGEPVMVRPQSLTGLIRFVGPVRFAPGCWIGVDLDLPQGRNDGQVKGVEYFQCRPKHGIFVKVDKLIWDHRRSRAQKTRSGAFSCATIGGRHSSGRGDMSSPASMTLPHSKSKSEGLSSRK